MRAPGRAADEALVQREAFGDLLLDGVQRVQEVIGSWKMKLMSLPRTRRRVRASAVIISRPAVGDRAGDVGVVGQQADGGERGDRLARAAFADEGEGLAGVEVEADVAHGVGRARRPGEGRPTGRGR